MILYTGSLCWWYQSGYPKWAQVSPLTDPKFSPFAEHLESRTLLTLLYPKGQTPCVLNE